MRRLTGLPRELATLCVAAVIFLPLLGVIGAGGNVRELFRFPPPLDIPDGYLTFSWAAAAGVCACLAGLALPWLTQRRRWSKASASARHVAFKSRRFPGWGVLALLWTVAWWVLAWTRSDWFAPLQRYTFFPLWIGFILVVNAAAEQRSGSCLMCRAPRRWLGLFVASAGCWWTFEWLNRFVHNWHYLGVEDFGPASYAFHASLCFSTVLPAVAAVAEWLSGAGSWNPITACGPKWSWVEQRGVAVAWVLLSVLALVGTGMRPTWFYPALWIAPLSLFMGAQVLAKRTGLASELARGDWSRAATWMVAALACGFFWELWNWRSAAKWIYTVPGVERWHVFEMPLLGYAGYLPFGLECLIVTEFVIGRRWQALPPEAEKTADAR